MAVTKVQNRLATTTESTSLSVTPSSTPVAGNLLTIVHFASGGGDQSTIAGPAGFTKAIGTTTGTSSGDIAIYYKVSAGTESGALTCTNPVGTGSSTYLIFSEWSAGGAFSSPLHKTGTAASSGTSGTVAASAASTVAVTFALAAFGLNGNSGGFLNTYTGGFTQDQTYQARVDIGTKTTTTTETSSTTETWTTSRNYRAVFASFVVPTTATLSAPTGLAAAPISSSQINLSWNAVSGATAYGVYRDGVALTLTNPTTTYSDTGLAPSSTHTYEVDAAS